MNALAAALLFFTCFVSGSMAIDNAYAAWHQAGTRSAISRRWTWAACWATWSLICATAALALL